MANSWGQELRDFLIFFILFNFFFILGKTDLEK